MYGKGCEIVSEDEKPKRRYQRRKTKAKTGRKPKERKALPLHKRDICPYGNTGCPICSLPREELLKVHDFKYNKGWTYDQMMEYLSGAYGIGRDKRVISDHFLRHTSNANQIENAVKRRNVPIRNVRKQTQLDKVTNQIVEYIPEEARTTTSQDMQKAYELLTNLTADFTGKIDQIVACFEFDKDKLREQLKGMSILDVMDRLGKLNKEAREQISAISSLRRPKVVVSQFLDRALDEIIYDTGALLSEMAAYIQQSVLNAIKAREEIDSKFFTKIFREYAIRFKEQMESVKRSNMQNALQSLADLEKVI